MNGVFHIGATGLHSQERALGVVANNITNINTVGFKRSEVRFSELVATLSGDADPSFAAVAEAGRALGVAADISPRIFAQGDLRETGNALDLALSGEGFIELLGPGGETLLWRGGTLMVDEDGFLAAAGGLPLKAMISVPDGANGLSIDRAGNVRVIAPGETEPSAVGRIDRVLVRNVGGLSAIDGGLYRAADGADLVVAPDDDAGAFVQGSLELSNVELTDEMVALLMMQRAYAASAQIVQAGDQLMSIANSLRR